MNPEKTFTLNPVENIFISKTSERQLFWAFLGLLIFQTIGVFFILIWFKFRVYPHKKITDIAKSPPLSFSFKNSYFFFPKELLPPFCPNQISASQIQKVERRIAHMIFYTSYGKIEIPFLILKRRKPLNKNRIQTPGEKRFFDFVESLQSIGIPYQDKLNRDIVKLMLILFVWLIITNILERFDVEDFYQFKSFISEVIMVKLGDLPNF